MNNSNGFNYYENSGYRNDRKKTISLILDIDEDDTDSNRPLTSGSEFTVNLFEPLLIDKKSTVYLDSFLTYNSNISNNPNNSAFALKINEFNIQSICGNRSGKTDNISGRILIPNEKDSLGHYYSTVQHKAKKFNYVCDINPCKLTKITGNIKNIHGDTAFAGSKSTNNKIIGIFNIEASWNSAFDKGNDGKTIVTKIKYSINKGENYSLNPQLTDSEVISDSPMNSNMVLLSVSDNDYLSIMELAAHGGSSGTFKNNLENITNIVLTTDSSGGIGGEVETTLTGDSKFFIKQDQGFKLITEFVIVSE
jgi:hypothetical protein